MSELVWYSRLAVWAGAAVLLLQAVTGRSTGLMTALAVVALSAGFVAFIAGLARGGQPVSEAPAPGPSTATAGAMASPAPGEAVSPAATEPIPFVPPQAEQDLPPPRAGPQPETAPATPVFGRVYAVEVEEDSAEAGATCPHCSREVAVGQVAVSCFHCGTTHHAACWTEHHFHCAAPGCPAQGGIEAPSGGPSKP